MVPDLVLKAILSNKKSVSEIFNFCEDNDICQDTPGEKGEKRVKQAVAKQLLKVSGFNVDKSLDYRALFKEMSRTLLKCRGAKGNNDDEHLDNVVKISPKDLKCLSETASDELVVFLLYNGIDLQMQTPSPKNLHYKNNSSVFESS